jgi:uncharacterized protein YcbX
MGMSVTHIWRHPIKALGCEAISQVALQAGTTMPWDRVWAVLHEANKFDQTAPVWVSKNNFNQGAKTPSFMAIKAQVNEGTGVLTLTHPDLPDLTVNPDVNPDALVAWIKPLVPNNRAQPVGVAKVEGRGLTDQQNPYISIIGTASLGALSQAAGQPLQQERFRANFWLDGLDPWEEFNWIGHEIQIGGATLRVDARIGRCVATTANPASGKIDIDTFLLRENWGHKDLGVFAEVINGGTIAVNDKVKVLS